MPHIDADSPILLAMVPGMGTRPIDFSKRGLVAEIERRGWRIKVAIIDPGPDSYLDNAVEARILDAVAEARRQTGASRLWLAGISLGCQGILRCQRAQPGLADGLLWLTLYLASTGPVAEVARAGGLRQWAAMDQSRGNKPDQALLAWRAATHPPRCRRC